MMIGISDIQTLTAFPHFHSSIRGSKFMSDLLNPSTNKSWNLKDSNLLYSIFCKWGMVWVHDFPIRLLL